MRPCRSSTLVALFTFRTDIFVLLFGQGGTTYSFSFPGTRKQMYCYFCDSNKPRHLFNREHILPQSIGGSVKKCGPICRTCNEYYGEQIDQSLREDFDYLATALDVHRDRGKNGKVRLLNQISGSGFLAKPGGRIVRESNIVQVSEKTYHLYGSTLEEIEDRKKELSKRGKQIIITETLSVPEKSSSFYKYRITQGRDRTLRSIVKSAITYYLSERGEAAFLRGLRMVVNGTAPKKTVITPYVDKNRLLPAITDTEVYHSILIVGDAKRRILYGHVELFSAFRYIVMLCRDYPGSDFRSGYKQDVFTGRRTPLESDWIYTPMRAEQSSIQYEFDENLLPLLKLLYRRSWKHMYGRPLSAAFFDFPAGTVVDDQFIDQAFLRTHVKLESGIEDE